MNRLFQLAFAALTLVAAHLLPTPAGAAMVPAGLGKAADMATSLPASAVRFGGRGGGFRGGFRGHRGFAHRGWGPRRHSWGPRRHVRWGYAPVVSPYGCIRKGWVWNGYRYVWRRYRVC